MPTRRATAKTPRSSNRPALATPWESVSNREEQREAKRNAVLQAAAELFNERGFHATSLDDVAARLNVSKPTLYYYVKSKDEILIQCVHKGLEMALEGIEASRRAGGQAIDQLIACMRVYGTIVTMDFGMCIIRVGEEGLSLEGRKQIRQLKAGVDRAFRRLVSEGVKQGALAPCDVKLTAFTIAGALSWIAHWYRPDGPYSREEVVEQCVITLLNGVLRRPGVVADGASSADKSVDRSTGDR